MAEGCSTSTAEMFDQLLRPLIDLFALAFSGCVEALYDRCEVLHSQLQESSGIVLRIATQYYELRAYCIVFRTVDARHAVQH